ncbi:uricase [Fomitiporia mediterranea MF3/22]|uniref:uricase n=1 Tax=Fomitiporia mediterranea (strain MF3/22) TaxID=694068 RepID=UPI0004408525|nr:uricase [Fomitiporia mediterranea MF3/22]EJD06754.1 uricase [Fomitiporia mediterranea MF3/22]
MPFSGVELSAARYGKDKVRVLRVVRGEGWHDVVEYEVCALVEGDISTSYTQADNSVVVATDSIKNITYYIAKTSAFVLVPEIFGLHLGAFLLGKYEHLHRAFITVTQLRWQRITVDGKKHPNSFWRDGDEKRTVNIEIDATQGKDAMTARVTSGIRDLLVLKSTGSAFSGFVRDEFTTLVEVDDRILSTSIDLQYEFASISLGEHKSLEKKLEEIKKSHEFDRFAARAREITLAIFAKDESASVQATLFRMATEIIKENQHVQRASYALPNKHYVPVDMKYIGVDNMTPAKAEVFCPLAAPSGLITASVDRRAAE